MNRNRKDRNFIGMKKNILTMCFYSFQLIWVYSFYLFEILKRLLKFQYMLHNIMRNKDIPNIYLLNYINQMIIKKLRIFAFFRRITPFYQFSIHNYMKTHQRQHIAVNHGRVRVDQNQLEFQDPNKLQQFISKYNQSYAKQSLKWAHRTNSYLERVNSRKDQRNQSTPQIYNNYEYFTKVNWFNGRQYSQIWRKQLNKGKSELVLDIMSYSFIKKCYQTVQLIKTNFSPCTKYIAFGFDLHNNEQVSFMIKNIKRDTIVGIKNWEQNRIKGVDNLIFAGLDGILYTKVHNHRPSEVWYQSLKTEQNYLLYKQNNADCYLDIFLAKDEKHIIVSSNSKNNSRTWSILVDEEKKTRLEMRQIKVNKQDTKVYLNHNGKDFVVWRDAPEGHSISLLNESNNQEKSLLIVPSSSHESITDIDIFESYVVLYMRKITSPIIKVIQLINETNTIYDISLPYEIGSVQPGANQMLQSQTFIFYLNNVFVYNEGYQYQLKSKQLTLKEKFQLTGPKFNPKDYIVQLHQVPAEDGQIIPLTTIVPKRNSNKRNKMLLNCYGHYGLPYEIAFNNVYWTALQFGWSLAYAHIRGGGEKGRKWHIAGVKNKKYKNWIDLEDSVAYLLRKQYTHPNVLILSSHSAGSITIWNTINRYPHLYKAVIMSYPFLDVLGALLDKNKPLTQSDYPQFGNPKQSLITYNQIQSFSPYDNIQKKPYPFIYLVGGTKDYRCPMEQIAKFVKRYREVREWKSEQERFQLIGEKGLLVKVNQGSHEGLADLTDQIRDGCEMFACMDYLIEEASNDVKFKN